MFTRVVVEIVSGEICIGGQQLYIDCDKVRRQGEERRRMVMDNGENRDIKAFYFSVNGIEYGKIGAREVDFSNLCNHCCGSDAGAGGGGGGGGGGSNYWAEYNDDYREDFFI